MMMLVSGNYRSTQGDEHVGKLFLIVLLCKKALHSTEQTKEYTSRYPVFNQRDDRLGIFQYSIECAKGNITEY